MARKQFLDPEDRVKLWPKKKELRMEILSYLAEKFDSDTTYTEKQVNEILVRYHTFNDYFLLRRELIESGLLLRTRDGSAYWLGER